MESAAASDRRIRRIETQLRRLTHERVYILEPDGRVVFRADGRERTVSLPNMLAHGRLVIHNHPNGESFSRADVRVSLQVGAAEFRVMTDRYRFRLRHGGDIRWDDVEQLVAQLYFQEMEQAVDRVRRGVATTETASRDILHRVWERAAQVVGWDYRREVLFDG